MSLVGRVDGMFADINKFRYFNDLNKRNVLIQIIKLKGFCSFFFKSNMEGTPNYRMTHIVSFHIIIIFSSSFRAWSWSCLQSWKSDIQTRQKKKKKEKKVITLVLLTACCTITGIFIDFCSVGKKIVHLHRALRIKLFWSSFTLVYTVYFSGCDKLIRDNGIFAH